MALLNFDATQVQPDSGQVDPFPAGWYIGMIDNSELKPTKSGSGAYLSVRVKVADGKHAGRTVFTQFNIRNENPTAQEIAYKQLSALAHAVGVLQVQDSQQLHGIPFKFRVKITPATDQYAAKNEITAFRNMSEQVEMADAAANQANPFAAKSVQAPQANPFAAQQSQMPAPTPQPATQQWQPPAAQQPWNQPQAQQAEPITNQQQSAMPAWAQQAAPTVGNVQAAPTQVQMSPEQSAAVQQAQASVPPWMQQK